MRAAPGDQLVRVARRLDWSMLPIAALVLILCLFYILAFAFLAPFPGMDLNSEWRVLSLDSMCSDPLPQASARRAEDGQAAPCQVGGDRLAAGDRMTRIGDLTFDEYRSGRTSVPFAGYERGEIAPITFLHEGKTVNAEWRVLGPTRPARLVRLSSVFFILPFWLAGTIVLLFLRPRDTRWFLLIAFNYLTAVWLAAGFPSATRIAGSWFGLTITTAFLLPVYLDLHLRIPAPIFPRLIPYLLRVLYGSAGALILLQLLETRSDPAVGNLVLLVAVGGSLALLALRLARPARPADRLATRLMMAGVILAFGPGILMWVIPGLLGTGGAAGAGGAAWQVLTYVSTLTLVPLPFFYVYALFKHRLGGLEFRANRFLSLYSFLLLLAAALVVVFVFGSQRLQSSGAILLFALMVSVLFVFAALFLRTPFQRLIDRLAYGTEHNAEDIVRTFADRIPTALSGPALADLLTREVAPSLLIRQSALYHVTSGEAALLYADHVSPPDDARALPAIQRLLQGAGRYRPADPANDAEYAWVRLSLPITVGGRLIGAWLFGKRDPDDFYPQPDIELLATLSNQIGLALETTRLFESLQGRASELERAYGDLQKLDKLKDEFVQNVSHELRTPLTFVRGYTELMLDGALGALTPEQREALASVLERLDGIVRLVNDIISVQQAAVEHLIPDLVDVTTLARSCLQAAEMMAQRQRPALWSGRFELDAPDEGLVVPGDRSRLGQVLDNLLDNAVKFSPNGGTVTVRVRATQYRFSAARCDSVAQPAVEVSVSDHGIGISADKIEHIWGRFYQVDGSRTRRFGGMGLGLAIVRNIVIAHAGAISVESIEGEGTTFYVVLPGASAAAPSADASAPSHLAS